METNTVNNFMIIDNNELVDIQGGVAPIILFFYGVGAGIAGTATAVHTINGIANLKW